MFGYVRPVREELKVKDWEAYQAQYCGLCHCLKEQGGLVARFILNYDFTFLSMLLDDGAAGTVCRRRCAAHPFRKRPCVPATPAMELCAWESLILAHYKLGDSVADEGFWTRTGSCLAVRLLKGAYQKANAHCRDFDHQVAMCLWELDELERAGSPQLDRVADTFARLLSGAAPETGDPGLDRPRRQLLYHLGRWIYLMDALDDLDDDARAGRYNPVAARFGGQVDRTYLDTTMRHSVTLAQAAFQLLPRGRWAEVLENILYLGLPAAQRGVLEGTWNKKEKMSGSIKL